MKTRCNALIEDQATRVKKKYNVLSITMRRIRQRREGGEVIEPIQRRPERDRVDAAEEEVHRIRFTRAQAIRELLPDKIRDGRGRQIGLVAHRVQLHVCLDVFGELHYSIRHIRL